MPELLVKLDKSRSEMREMLMQVYGDNAMRKTAVYKWMTRFSDGRGSVTDEERSGQPAMSTTEENIERIMVFSVLYFIIKAFFNFILKSCCFNKY
jgi:hypothetical protein